MSSYWIRVGPKSRESVHIRGRRKHTFFSQREGDEGDVKMEAETGMVYLQVIECQGLPATTRSWERGMDRFPQSLQKESTLPTI